MRDEEQGATEGYEPGWRDRLWAIGSAAGRLIETRTAILQEELAEKGGLLGRGLVAFFVAALFGVIAGLLLTALLAAVLSRLLGGAILGILATFVLYLMIAGVAGWLGVRKLSRLRPFEFPATRREIDRDLEAVRNAAGVGEGKPREPAAGHEAPAPGPVSTEEMEARLREGAS
jgi:uncharacterized membrane protein YqjE